MDEYRVTKRRIQRPSKDKKAWTKEEDTVLLKLVAEHGVTMWSKISDALGCRSGKQCRERYHNHLDPSVKKGSWTREEDALILTLQKKYGNSWAKITSFLPGRTDNAVKNRYWSATRSKARREKLVDVRGRSASSASSASYEAAERGSVGSADEQSVGVVSASGSDSDYEAYAASPARGSLHSLHFSSNLKVNIPTSIAAVDYMSDEEISASFLDVMGEAAAPTVSPTSTCTSSDSSATEDDMLDVADFFQLGGDEGLSFEFVDNDEERVLLGMA
ncbi:hypothetical protein TeGR_g8253 [Tetraparma gracilis]|uniref:Uncharacterized protein n=1 Tax=Tetraparma gracilis TaxID=2962635 RepID=A0ABQ6N6I9_9STRA|nr:hypothetical protein TeGR_g8253 [Tetraparma gracilis]